MKTLLILAVITLASGCSTITIQPKQMFKLTTNPSYEDTKSFYLWGLIGEYTVDVKAICKDKKVLQMQTESTITDKVISLTTFGFYMPRRVKIWCES